jgi:hypothetical protein
VFLRSSGRRNSGKAGLGRIIAVSVRHGEEVECDFRVAGVWESVVVFILKRFLFVASAWSKVVGMTILHDLGPFVKSCGL